MTEIKRFLIPEADPEGNVYSLRSIPETQILTAEFIPARFSIRLTLNITQYKYEMVEGLRAFPRLDPAGQPAVDQKGRPFHGVDSYRYGQMAQATGQENNIVLEIKNRESVLEIIQYFHPGTTEQYLQELSDKWVKILEIHEKKQAEMKKQQEEEEQREKLREQGIDLPETTGLVDVSGAPLTKG